MGKEAILGRLEVLDMRKVPYAEGGALRKTGGTKEDLGTPRPHRARTAPRPHRARAAPRAVARPARRRAHAQAWNMSKRMERYTKIVVKGRWAKDVKNGMSAIEPVAYRDRFLAGMGHQLGLQQGPASTNRV